jgi:hypothetical protein
MKCVTVAAPEGEVVRNVEDEVDEMWIQRCTMHRGGGEGGKAEEREEEWRGEESGVQVECVCVLHDERLGAWDVSLLGWRGRVIKTPITHNLGVYYPNTPPTHYCCESTKST